MLSRFAKLSLPLLATAMVACADALPPMPSELAMTPNAGSSVAETEVTVTGRNISAGIKVDFKDPNASMVLTTVTLHLKGATDESDLINVRLEAKDTLKATVPAGLTFESYDLQLTDPFGRTITQPAAYTVRASSCSDFNAPGGADCVICAATAGCACNGMNECVATCGDGLVREEEDCDDLNTAPDDGCSPGCEVEPGFACNDNEPSVCSSTCGDGVRAADEDCDDGDTMAGDGCAAACTVEAGYSCTNMTGMASVCSPVCGNGIVTAPETCDDNDTQAGDGCSDTCAVETGFNCMNEPSMCTPICGDSLVRGGEGCDDGLLLPGDGCSELCAVEMGYACSGEPSMCSPGCNDGVLVMPPEECDDANSDDGDGCSAACVIERGFECPMPGMLCNTICSDGIVAGLEACDDANTDNGDGCNATCTMVELGFMCPDEGQACDPICGDSRIVLGENCDDANTDSGDGCSTTCMMEMGWQCTVAGSPCVEVCGDDMIVGMENCDDGDATGGDGCSARCLREPGWMCPMVGQDCVPACGDSMRVTGETCDDGNMMAGDGCSATCAQELGYTCTGVGPGSCTVLCGDGIILAPETCDDSDQTGGDGCSATCTVELGYTCTGMPSTCVITCGNSVLDPMESCDDANRTAGDGCSAGCSVEPNYSCIRLPSICALTAQISFVDDTGPSCPVGGAGTLMDPYCTIGQGIAATSAFIFVRVGTYAETITASGRTAELIAESGAVLDGASPVLPALTIEGGSSLSILGLTVVGGDPRIWARSADVVLDQVTIGPEAAGVGMEVSLGATVSVDRSSIISNAGGGIFLDTTGDYALTNNIVVMNGVAGTSGYGGIYVARTSAGSVLVNNTIADNRSTASGGAVAGVFCDVIAPIVNSIVYANTSGAMPTSVSSSCAPSYSDLNPLVAGTGNFNVDPRLSPTYHLLTGSPAINAGDPAGVQPAGPAPGHDIDGQVRPLGPRVDVGADESQ